MENNNISSDLIRGHINTIILRTLYDGDKYGYEICKIIEEKSSGQYILKQPTLYSALNRLESQKFIEAYWGGVTNGGRRRYFKLTEQGKEIAKKNLSEWEYSRTVIDKLISEDDYDLTKPAPTNVNFNILKQSTSKIKNVIACEDTQTKDTSNVSEEVKKETNTGENNLSVDDLIENNKKYKLDRIYKDKLNKLYNSTINTENERKNYFIENTKDDIINKTIEEKFNYVKQEDKLPTKKENNNLNIENFSGKINFSDLFEKAEIDGIKLKTCNNKKSNLSFYNQGKLICLSSMLFMILGLIYLNVFKFFIPQINITKKYYLLLNLIIVAPVIVSFVLMVLKFKNKVSTTMPFNYTSIILVIIFNLILIIFAVNLIMSINLSIINNIVIYVALPILLILNLLFSYLYLKFLINRKRAKSFN